MATAPSGYSGTPLAKKLGIKPGHTIALVRGPEGFDAVLAETLPPVALPAGLVDNKVCAIDETWSGLQVVWRKERRAALRG